MSKDEKIKSIEEFLRKTERDSQEWGFGDIEDCRFLWYRGEPNCNTPLLPKLYRKIYKGDYFENRLLQHFRMQAPSPELGKAPNRNYTDQWLFLAQHVGLPTRLLDWTESSLTGLYFALQEEAPVVWMLDPFELNCLSVPSDKLNKKEEYNIHSLTWWNPQGRINIGSESIEAAWSNRESRLLFPVAIRPTFIHLRMTAQKSCFTIQGRAKESIFSLLSEEDILRKYIKNPEQHKQLFDHLSEIQILKRYIIDKKYSKEMLKQLRQMGISERTLFPDLDGLAKDLTSLFRPDLINIKK